MAFPRRLLLVFCLSIWVCTIVAFADEEGPVDAGLAVGTEGAGVGEEGSDPRPPVDNFAGDEAGSSSAEFEAGDSVSSQEEPRAAESLVTVAADGAPESAKVSVTKFQFARGPLSKTEKIVDPVEPTSKPASLMKRKQFGLWQLLVAGGLAAAVATAVTVGVSFLFGSKKEEKKSDLPPPPPEAEIAFKLPESIPGPQPVFAETVQGPDRFYFVWDTCKYYIAPGCPGETYCCQKKDKEVVQKDLAAELKKGKTLTQKLWDAVWPYSSGHESFAQGKTQVAHVVKLIEKWRKMDLNDEEIGFMARFWRYHYRVRREDPPSPKGVDHLVTLEEFDHHAPAFVKLVVKNKKPLDVYDYLAFARQIDTAKGRPLIRGKFDPNERGQVPKEYTAPEKKTETPEKETKPSGKGQTPEKDQTLEKDQTSGKDGPTPPGKGRQTPLGKGRQTPGKDQTPGKGRQTPERKTETPAPAPNPAPGKPGQGQTPAGDESGKTETPAPAPNPAPGKPIQDQTPAGDETRKPVPTQSSTPESTNKPEGQTLTSSQTSEPVQNQTEASNQTDQPVQEQAAAPDQASDQASAQASQQVGEQAPAPAPASAPVPSPAPNPTGQLLQGQADGAVASTN
eukprot:GHVT01045027.1.p1 GENE.GHVT01045027.1~~GHVT01045027.1.p1  ORF type:complete len:621 (+),score=110.39 GHVT01045027.1:277-2139(+)